MIKKTYQKLILLLLLLGTNLLWAQSTQIWIKPSFGANMTRISFKDFPTVSGDVDRYLENVTLGTELGHAVQPQLLAEFRIWNRLGLTTGIGANFYQMRFRFGSRDNFKEWDRIINITHSEIPVHLTYYQPLSANGYGLKISGGINIGLIREPGLIIASNNSDYASLMQPIRPSGLLFSYFTEVGWYFTLNKWSELHFSVQGIYGWNKNLISEFSFYDLPDSFDRKGDFLGQISEIDPVFTEKQTLALDQLGFSISYSIKIWGREK